MGRHRLADFEATLWLFRARRLKNHQIQRISSKGCDVGHRQVYTCGAICNCESVTPQGAVEVSE